MADLKQLARRIFHETLAAIDIPLAMQRKLVREGSVLRCGQAAIDLSKSERVRVVAIGGGTGLSTLLRGLKAHTSNLTAVVTVADDGGSSGRLRRWWVRRSRSSRCSI